MGDAQFTEEDGEGKKSRGKAGKSAWIYFVSWVGADVHLINECFNI